MSYPGNYVQSGHALLASDQTTSSTSYADISGMSVTMTTGANVLIVTISLCALVATLAGALQLVLDGSAVTGVAATISIGTVGVAMTYRAAVAAGSHTAKLQWKAGTGGSVALTVTTLPHHCSLLVEEAKV